MLMMKHWFSILLIFLPLGMLAQIMVDVTRLSTVSVSDDLQAWMDEVENSGGSVPSNDQLLLLDDVIDDLTTASLWTGVFDAIYIFDQDGSRIAGQVNFIDPNNYECTVPGSTPLWTSNEGLISYESGGGYLDANFNPATAGGYFSQDDMCMIVIIEGCDAIANNKYFYAFGAISSTAGDAWHSFSGAQSSDSFNSRSNDETTENNTTSSGLGSNDFVMYTSTRTGSTSISYYENTSSMGSSTTTSTSRPSYDFFIGTVNSSGTPVLATEGVEIKLVAFGESLTSTQITNFYNAWATFLNGQ